MLLYLVQHGKAKTEDEDPERPLTDEGRREVESVMLLMLRAGAITASRVLHSEKLRAGETAKIIATKLDADTAETDGLAPGDDPEIWATRLRESNRDTVLVGHLPHLSRLAARLLAGDAGAGIVEFVNGGIVCLHRNDDGAWGLRWAVTPSLVH
jgi:phosphohistidine phosphatase